MERIKGFLRTIWGFSLKKYALESRKRLLTSIPPELIFMKRGDIPEYDIFHEPDFIHKITKAWHRPAAIDTTYFALQVKDKIGEPLEKDEKEKIKKFVMDLYREDKKGFLQTESHPCPFIHSIHAAIGIMNLLYSPNRVNNQVDLTKPMGRDLLQQYLGKNIVDSVIDFLLKCQREDGGFVECSYNSCNKSSSCPHTIPTINATASALWCLWHLEALGSCDMKKVLEFTMKHVVQENHKVGFKNEQADKRAWVCATYYAFRIFRSLSKLDLFDSLTRKETIDFILQCKDGKTGFAAARGFKPTILHTKDALSLIKYTNYDLDFDKFVNEKKLVNLKEELIKDIESFLNSCMYKGVYGFAEKEYYFPNVYATQLAIDIKRALKIMRKEKPEEAVDEKQKREILDFLESCRDIESVGYRGYSLDPNYIPPEWWESKKSNRNTSLEKVKI